MLKQAAVMIAFLTPSNLPLFKPVDIEASTGQYIAIAVKGNVSKVHVVNSEDKGHAIEAATISCGNGCKVIAVFKAIPVRQ